MQRSQLVSISTSTLGTLSSESYAPTLQSAASTFTGPGSLAGKALFSFGILTLKGVEQIIISRRLSVIATHFPHHNTERIIGLPGMYADLLELSRIHLYSDSTRMRALQLLFAQVASRSTAHLLKALLVWPLVEVNLLLSELLRTSYLVEHTLEHSLISSYRQHLSQWEDHSLAPIIDFLQDVGTSSEQGWSIICDCGSLDFLLHLYVSDFTDHFTVRTQPFNKSSLSATCNSFLVAVLANSSACTIFQSHPISDLWSLWPMLALESNSDLTRCSQRRQVWATLELREFQWRISSIFDTLVLEWDSGSSMRKLRVTLKEPSLFDLLVDLLEFSGSSELNDQTSFRALRSLHRLWTRIDTMQFSWGLQKYIQETPEEHARGIFSQVIRQLHSLLDRAPESEAFFDFCHKRCQANCPLESDAVVQFIHRLSRASRSNKVLRQWLIEADIVGLLGWTFCRLSERGALNLDEGDSYKISDYSVSGPRYRTLVLSLAWCLFNEEPHGSIIQDHFSASMFFMRQNPPPNWDNLRFPIYHHDNWADDLMNASVYHQMEREHKECVYSWIMNS
ncbi:hypothetical protein DFH05DRAFT_1520119 [Lentinula detonsa]|uniref:Uncharacterized protein n=1 Tax=Lentinula detonsa TaxID=2804962 RepID=A0A9W8P7E5_9AGAR|nr:hypothetical protein DFH05DRAFT_1520119 [Lentinula detonsa]